MILYMKYDVDTEEAVLTEGTSGTQSYCLNVDMKHLSRVSLEDSRPVIKEKAVDLSVEGDPIDFFMKIAPSYEEAYLYNEGEVFLFNKGKFEERELPELKICETCGRIVPVLFENQCEECFIKILPQELSSVYIELGEDYTPYEKVSKIKDFVEKIKRRGYYKEGASKINEEINNFVKKLLSKAGMEESEWTAFIEIC